jgi:AraC-like DNA-binding protein
MPSTTPSGALATVRSRNLSDWAAGIERAYGPVRVGPSRRAAFDGTFTPMNAAGLPIARVAANVALVEQPKAERPPDACDWFLVTSLAGRATMTHCGRTAAIGVGDFLLVCEAGDRRLEFEGPFEHVAVRLEPAFVAQHAEAERLHGPRHLPAESPLARPLVTLLRQLAVERCSRLETLGLRDAAWDLIGYVLRAMAAADSPPHLTARRLRLLARARALIAERIEDPALSAEIVARHAAMSVRSLHRLFAEAGCSVGTEIRECRLQHYRALLASERHRHDGTSVLAYASGYSDAAYATRVFRARFGATPSAFREEILGRRAAP